MATTGVFNGTDLLLKLTDGTSIATSTIIGHSTSCSLSLSNDLPEATTKDSNGFSRCIFRTLSTMALLSTILPIWTSQTIEDKRH